MLLKGRVGTRAEGGLVPFDVDRPAVEAARRDRLAFEPLHRMDAALIVWRHARSVERAERPA